jgi:hypothetical protein
MTTETKTPQPEGAGNPGATAPGPPSWEDFCERLLKQAPTLKPDQADEQWQNLYGVYRIGYEACLDAMIAALHEDGATGGKPK